MNLEPIAHTSRTVAPKRPSRRCSSTSIDLLNVGSCRSGKWQFMWQKYRSTSTSRRLRGGKLLSSRTGKSPSTNALTHWDPGEKAAYRIEDGPHLLVVVRLPSMWAETQSTRSSTPSRIVSILGRSTCRGIGVAVNASTAFACPPQVPPPTLGPLPPRHVNHRLQSSTSEAQRQVLKECVGFQPEIRWGGTART